MMIPKPHGQKKFYRRWWFWLIVVLLPLSGGTVALVMLTQSSQPLAVDMISDTVTVERRDLKKTVSTTGKVVPEHSEQLSFAIAGQTTAVNYRPGDLVNKDDDLVKIDGGSFARAADEVLAAPFDGRILAVETFVDDTVTPGAAVVELGYRSNFIEFTASESEVFDLAVGQAVDITIPSLDDGSAIYRGVIEFIDTVKTQAGSASQVAITGQGSSETGFIVQVRPTDVPSEAINLVGLTVDLDVVVAEQADSVAVERAAVQYDEDDQPFVYLPTTDPTLTALPQQTVALGFEADEYVEITSGLQVADEVVLYIPEANVTSPF
jgi:hypothetical protein